LIRISGHQLSLGPIAVASFSYDLTKEAFSVAWDNKLYIEWFEINVGPIF